MFITNLFYFIFKINFYQQIIFFIDIYLLLSVFIRVYPYFIKIKNYDIETSENPVQKSSAKIQSSEDVCARVMFKEVFIVMCDTLICSM